MAKKNISRPDYCGVEFEFNGKTLCLMVKNVSEKYGHDDSWPYQCDWSIRNLYTGEEVLKGIAYNDGWGGDTSVCVSNCNYSLSGEISEALQEQFTYIPKGYTFTMKLSLDEMIDTLADYFYFSGVRGYYSKETMLKSLKR